MLNNLNITIVEGSYNLEQCNTKGYTGSIDDYIKIIRQQILDGIVDEFGVQIKDTKTSRSCGKIFNEEGKVIYTITDIGINKVEKGIKLVLDLNSPENTAYNNESWYSLRDSYKFHNKLTYTIDMI